MRVPGETTWADRPGALAAPRRGLTRVFAVLAAALAAAAPRAAQGQAARSRAAPAPTLRPQPPRPNDRLLDAAVTRGLEFLWRRQSNGRWKTKYARRYPCGVEALAALAALASGQKPQQANLKAALEYIDALKPQTVYARAVRTILYARLPGERYARRLAEDAAWLVRNQAGSGGWGYGPGHPTTVSRKEWVDNSNTQLALLALDEAAEAGAPVPKIAWRRAMRYWLKAQNADGGWGYEPRGLSPAPLRPGSYGSPSAAGVASMLILHDRLLPTYQSLPGELFADDGGGRASASLRRAVARGLAWLDRHYTLAKVPRWLWGGRGDEYFLYYLHCLVRAAEAAGLTSIGGHDWAAEVVSLLLRRQRKDGSWALPDHGATDAVVQTGLALLVLARCRKPLLVSELTFDGGPCARGGGPRRLVRWLSRAPARPVAWALLDANADAAAYRRAPILYIDFADAPPEAEITPAMTDKILQFLRLGGTAVIQCPGGDRRFAARMVALFRRAAGQWKAIPLADGHPLFRRKFRIPPVAVTGIGDAERTRVFLLIDDLSARWRRGFENDSPDPFHLFANLVVCATQPGELPGRFVGLPRATPGAQPATKSITVARVRHRGGWKLCPAAMPRLGEVLRQAVSLAVKQAPAVDLAGPVGPGPALLWMTGTDDPALGPPQRRNLRQYLDAGGMVFMDSAMGGRAFFDAAMAILVEMFGRQAVRPLPKTHPLLTGGFSGGLGAEVTTVSYTPAAKKRPSAPVLYAVTIEGRVAAVLSPAGVTVPISGVRSYGCIGLSAPDARRLAANVVLYAASHPR